MKVHIILSFEHFLTSRGRLKRLQKKCAASTRERKAFLSLQTALAGRDFQLDMTAANLVLPECTVSLKIDATNICNMTTCSVEGWRDESSGYTRFFTKSTLSIDELWSRSCTQESVQPKFAIGKKRADRKTVESPDEGLLEDFDFHISCFADLVIVKHMNQTFFRLQKVMSKDLKDLCKQSVAQLQRGHTFTSTGSFLFDQLSKKSAPSQIPPVVITKAKTNLYSLHYYFATTHQTVQEIEPGYYLAEYYSQMNALFLPFSSVLAWSNEEVVRVCQEIVKTKLLDEISNLRVQLPKRKGKQNSREMEVGKAIATALEAYTSTAALNKLDLLSGFEAADVQEYVEGSMQKHLTYNVKQIGSRMRATRRVQPFVFQLDRFIVWFEAEDYVKEVMWCEKDSNLKGQIPLLAFKKASFLCSTSSGLYFKGLVLKGAAFLIIISEVAGKLVASNFEVSVFPQAFPSIRCASHMDAAVCLGNELGMMLAFKKEKPTARKPLSACFSSLKSNYSNHSKADGEFPEDSKSSSPVAMNSSHFLMLKLQTMRGSVRSTQLKVVAFNHLRVQIALGYCCMISQEIHSCGCFRSNNSLFCYILDVTGALLIVGLAADKLQLIEQMPATEKARLKSA